MIKPITKTSLCFTAKWISPETGKPVTALHFSSFINCTRKLHRRELHTHTNKRF